MSSGATWERRGAGDRSYLFVHGTPSDRRVFSELAERAPEDTALLLLDLPDHGAAAPEPTGSLEPLEAAVIEAVEAAPGRVTVVGHSIGAWLAASVSSRLPARVERFVALAGLDRFTEEDVTVRRGLVAQLEREELSPDDLREALTGMFFGDERTPALDAAVRPMLELSRERWLRIAHRSLRLGERAPVGFDRPALLIHGARDAAVPLARGEALAAASAEAELEVLDTASHMLPLTHADALAARIFAP